MKKQKRLFAPIGGVSDTSGHEIEFFCLSDVAVIKSIGFSTYQTADGAEHVEPWDWENLDQAGSLLQSFLPEKSPRFLAEMEKINAFNKAGVEMGAGFFGPLTCAAALTGVEKLSRMVAQNSAELIDLLSAMTRVLCDSAKMFLNSKAAFLWIAEPLAVLLSPEDFEKYSGVFLKRIFETTDKARYLHVCGDVTVLLEVLDQTGASHFSLDYQVDLYQTLHTITPGKYVMGNIDPVFVKNASPGEIYAASMGLLEKMKNWQNFIFSTGCLLPGSTPAENIRAMKKAVDDARCFSDEEFQTISRWKSYFLSSSPTDPEQAQSPDPALICGGLEEALHHLYFRLEGNKDDIEEYVMQVDNIKNNLREINQIKELNIKYLDHKIKVNAENFLEDVISLTINRTGRR